ncbi:MAG: hypothetical protein U5K79_09085 [Cyclobacteriaceae bacterium]|nr:hypothetical protein [Cyclobacteriaceae bacterium]
METITIDIINPKAKILLKGLADLDLIRINKEKFKPEFSVLLDKLRANSANTPTPEEITAEVESVRQARYEN